MKRIGVAFARPRGPTQRRSQYGIFREDPDSPAYFRYEGYREKREDGEFQVGLPLSGPNADWAQPLVPYDRTYFVEVRFFDEPQEVQW